jgi:prepilin-type N-terminal cleavage/methylation domain-containing protein
MLAKFLRFKWFAARGGFTVIEVMIAIGVLSVGVLGLAKGAIMITRANQTSQFQTTATNLAQDMLEQLQARSFAAITACSSSCDATPPTLQGVTFTRSWTVTPSTTTFKQINVTVQWTDYTPHTITVSSAVYS